MTQEQEKLLDLLSEFDCICSECIASYALAEIDLLCAQRNIPIRGCEADIVMTYSHFKRFERAFLNSNMEDRELEGLHNNPNMPGWYYRYVDSSTTLYSLDHTKCRKAHGIAINIHIARCSSAPRSFGKVKWKLVEYLEEGMGYSMAPDYSIEKQRMLKSSKRETYITAGKAASRWILLSFYANTVKKLLRHDSISNRLLNIFERTALVDTNEESTIRIPREKTCLLEEGFFQNLKTCWLENTITCCSELSENYLEQRYGKNWKTRNLKDLPYRKENFACFASTTIPYAQYIKRISSDIASEGFLRKRDIWLAYEKYAGMKKYYKRHAWENLFFFLEQRYIFWKKYMPEKNNLLDKYNQGEYDYLWMQLNPYIKQIDAYAQKNLALIFDDDIWEITLELYRRNGYSNHAEALEEMRQQKRLPAITGPEIEKFLAETSREENNGV